MKSSQPLEPNVDEVLSLAPRTNTSPLGAVFQTRAPDLHNKVEKIRTEQMKNIERKATQKQECVRSR